MKEKRERWREMKGECGGRTIKNRKRGEEEEEEERAC